MNDAPDLQGILDAISDCRACEADFGFRPRPVVRISESTRLLICGQAPRRRVHLSGLPFDDSSGDRLRDWLGLSREAFYADERIGVAPMAFCYPGTAKRGGDLPPPPRCALMWRKPLLDALKQVELTLLVGLHAQRWALPRGASRRLGDTVSRWRDFAPAIIPLPHPSWRNTSWLKRHPWFDDELKPYLRQRVAEILAR
jgi:uracil-DNA glycosylase